MIWIPGQERTHKILPYLYVCLINGHSAIVALCYWCVFIYNQPTTFSIPTSTSFITLITGYPVSRKYFYIPLDNEDSICNTCASLRHCGGDSDLHTKHPALFPNPHWCKLSLANYFVLSQKIVNSYDNMSIIYFLYFKEMILTSKWPSLFILQEISCKLFLKEIWAHIHAHATRKECINSNVST